MKKALLAIAAFAALLCGCDKYGDRLDEIESRISALEQTCMDINANISTIQKIVDAQAAGISIKSVEKVDNGFQITFSDGTSYYIVNGPKGDSPAIQAVKDAADGKFYWKVNDEWLRTEDGAKVPVTGATPQLKIEDGEWFVSIDGGTTWEKLGVAKGGTDITFTEDDTAYYFDFGDGNVAKIAKMAAFILKVETDAVEVAAGKSVAVPYTIVGADATTHVVAEAQGYTAKVDESAKTVTITAGSSVEAGYVIVKAIRNSDGASTYQFISVNDGSQPATDDIIDVRINNVTYNSISYTAYPSRDDLPYLVMCVTEAYIEEYGLDTDEALFQDDMDYFINYLGFTIEELLDMASRGQESYTFENLDPETNYVIYAYGFNPDGTLGTPISRGIVSTPAKPEPKLEFYGTAIWHDVFFDSWFGLTEDGYNVDLDCDVYTDATTPGVYYFDSPYWYDNIAEWFDIDPETLKPYTPGNYKEAMIAINCSNPNAVNFPRQNMGASLGSDFGYLSAGSVAATGTFADNTITFEGHNTLVKSMEQYKGGGWYYVADGYTFTVKITPGGSPIKPASTSSKVVKPSKFIGSSAFAKSVKLPIIEK